MRGLQQLWTFKQRLIEQRHIRLTLAVGSCKIGLRSLAALITAMLLVSTSPSGALASHSSIVKVDLGCRGRIFKTGVLERLAAMNAATWRDKQTEVITSQKDLILSHTAMSSSRFSPTELLTSSGPILITDQLASPGDFLLHQLLSDYVKSFSDGKCVIISTSQDVTKWKAISSRSVSSCFRFPILVFYPIPCNIGIQSDPEARAGLDRLYRCPNSIS